MDADAGGALPIKPFSFCGTSASARSSWAARRASSTAPPSSAETSTSRCSLTKATSPACRPHSERWTPSRYSFRRERRGVAPGTRVSLSVPSDRRRRATDRCHVGPAWMRAVRQAVVEAPDAGAPGCGSRASALARGSGSGFVACWRRTTIANRGRRLASVSRSGCERFARARSSWRCAGSTPRLRADWPSIDPCCGKHSAATRRVWGERQTPSSRAHTLAPAASRPTPLMAPPPGGALPGLNWSR